MSLLRLARSALGQDRLGVQSQRPPSEVVERVVHDDDLFHFAIGEDQSAICSTSSPEIQSHG